MFFFFFLIYHLYRLAVIIKHSPDSGNQYIHVCPTHHDSEYDNTHRAELPSRVYTQHIVLNGICPCLRKQALKGCTSPGKFSFSVILQVLWVFLMNTNSLTVGSAATGSLDFLLQLLAWIEVNLRALADTAAHIALSCPRRHWLVETV